jgi:hypothetical protein
VVTVTDTVEALDPLTVTEAGETEHFAPDGTPEQASKTVPLKPYRGVRLSE